MRSEQPFAYELPFNTSSQLLMLDHAELLAKITKQKQAAEQTAIISRKKTSLRTKTESNYSCFCCSLSPFEN
jgi:hypothetical protein